MNFERFYSIGELSVANWFPYRDSMIRRMVKNGKLRSKRTETGIYMIPKSAVDEFLNKLDYGV